MVSVIALSLSHGGRRVHHGADDLVVSGAPAQVAREPVADLRLGGIGLPLEERLARHEEARRADAALERRALEEPPLERMQRLSPRHALDGLDPPPADLAAQHEAGADEPAIERDAAR